jgi:hypothetical protein
MMIPIKIQCGCGQKYAFEIEPVGGRMPSAVACPVCGTDGTAAANAVIAQSLPAQPPLAVTPAGAVRVIAPAQAPSGHPVTPAAPAPTAPPRGAARRPGQIDSTQVEHEARAKILWGDPPEAVVKFAMMQGLGREEASSLVAALFQERAATIRANGIRKIVMGTGLVFVPIVAFFIFKRMGVLPLKLFAITIMVGLWGAWMVLNGVFMVVAPKRESGDVAEQ